jgi:hypothetical protein
MIPAALRCGAGTSRTEASKYGEEEKPIGIPLVAASEEGTAQTEPAWETMRECGVIGPDRALVRKVEVVWNDPPEKVKVP